MSFLVSEWGLLPGALQATPHAAYAIISLAAHCFPIFSLIIHRKGVMCVFVHNHGMTDMLPLCSVHYNQVFDHQGLWFPVKISLLGALFTWYKVTERKTVPKTPSQIPVVKRSKKKPESLKIE